MADPPFFYFADPDAPIWSRTRAYAGRGEGAEIIEGAGASKPKYGIVTSQTCDIAEEDAPRPKRPWVQISPVYELSSSLNAGQIGQLRKFQGNAYFLHVPLLSGGFWVADFRIEFPVEKGWLANQRPLNGFPDEDLQRKVGERVALLRSRPAFAGSFVTAVQEPLVQSLRELKKQNRPLHSAILDNVNEVRVALDSYLAPKEARLILLVEEELPAVVWDWWLNWWDDAIDAASNLGFALHPLEQKTTAAMSVKEYKEMVAVPTDRVSPAG
ncbi:hypothetical protein [Streptomyces griseus]|uniref:hypothetical protein n=1 Tax=Streptomyces griseus TaxID=1911 RepID=UPI0033D8493C